MARRSLHAKRCQQKKNGDISIAMGSNVTFYENTCNIKGREGGHDPMYFHIAWKGWTKEQRVLQSKLSNEVEMQISKRPRLTLDPIQQDAVPYEDAWTTDDEGGAAEHDEKEVAGQGEEDEGEEEVEDKEEDEDKDGDENVDKKRVLQSTHKQPQIHWHSTGVAAFIASTGVIHGVRHVVLVVHRCCRARAMVGRRTIQRKGAAEHV